MLGKRGTMVLCLGNLPADVTRNDLKGFVRDAVAQIIDGRRRRLNSYIKHCSILRLTDRSTGSVSHQGLVEIRPAKVALDVMDALEHRPFRGVQLQVRRYRHSSVEVFSQRPTASLCDLLGLDDRRASRRPENFQLDLVDSTGADTNEDRSTQPRSAGPAWSIEPSG